MENMVYPCKKMLLIWKNGQIADQVQCLQMQGDAHWKTI